MTGAKVYIIICSIIGIIIWVPIGFILWIPALLLGTATFAFEVTEASINNSQIDESATARLNRKIKLYLRGFHHFNIIIKTALNDRN